MRMMQHMLPGLLTNVGEFPVQFAEADNAPAGALQKSLGTAIAGAVGAIVGPIATIVNAPGNNRTAQELAQQATLQAQIGAETAAQARAANMAMLKYAAGACLIGLTIYLLLR